jgi:hypothetical protein
LSAVPGNGTEGINQVAAIPEFKPQVGHQHMYRYMGVSADVAGILSAVDDIGMDHLAG